MDDLISEKDDLTFETDLSCAAAGSEEPHGRALETGCQTYRAETIADSRPHPTPDGPAEAGLVDREAPDGHSRSNTPTRQGVARSRVRGVVTRSLSTIFEVVAPAAPTSDD